MRVFLLTPPPPHQAEGGARLGGPWGFAGGDPADEAMAEQSARALGVTARAIRRCAAIWRAQLEESGSRVLLGCIRSILKVARHQ